MDNQNENKNFHTNISDINIEDKTKNEPLASKDIDELIYMAKNEDANAINELAYRYYLGKDISKDEKKAFKLWKKADEKDSINAKGNLAYCYYFGKGTEKNQKLAFSLFEELLYKYGKEQARYYLGECYYLGIAVKKDYKKAFEFFSQACKNNPQDLDSKYYLATMYYYGQYVEQNFEKAFELFNAIYNKKQDKDTKFYIGEMKYFGKGTNQSYKEAYEIFHSLYKDDVRAKRLLACMYFYGQYVQEERQKAYEFFKEIVSEENDNDGYSNYMLGIIRLESLKYDKETLKYFLKSAEKGFTEAQLWIGIQYVQGKYIEKSEKRNRQSMISLKKSAEQGNNDNQLRMAYKYISKYGNQINDRVVIEWLKKFAEQGNNNAQYFLGNLYINGKENDFDIDENEELGWKLIEESKKQKDPENLEEQEKYIRECVTEKEEILNQNSIDIEDDGFYTDKFMELDKWDCSDEEALEYNFVCGLKFEILYPGGIVEQVRLQDVTENSHIDLYGKIIIEKISKDEVILKTMQNINFNTSKEEASDENNEKYISLKVGKLYTGKDLTVLPMSWLKIQILYVRKKKDRFIY